MADINRIAATYQQSADKTTSATPSTATAMVATSLITEQAIFYADAGNTANIVIGPTSAGTLYSVAAGQWFLIEPKGGRPVDLATWYVKSSAASQTYRIEYL